MNLTLDVNFYSTLYHSLEISSMLVNFGNEFKSFQYYKSYKCVHRDYLVS
jgi:hypothetical protein